MAEQAPIRVLDLGADPNTGRLIPLDGKGGALPPGAPLVGIPLRPGELICNSLGGPFDPQPELPPDAAIVVNGKE